MKLDVKLPNLIGTVLLVLVILAIAATLVDMLLPNLRHARERARAYMLAASQPYLTIPAENPELRVIPKDLLTYKQVDRIAVDLPHAVALAVGPADNIYVCGAGGIRVYDAPIRGRDARDTHGRDAHVTIDTPADGTCIAVDGEGRIYCGFKDHVEIFDAQGAEAAAWPVIGGKPYLSSIALTSQEVYLADSGNRVIWRCDRAGKVLGRIGQKDPSRNVEGFVIPSPHFDVAVASDGLLRVADTGRHRVEAYTSAGDFEFAWGDFGNNPGEFCGCCNPSNICLLSDGRVVTAEKGLPTISIFKPDGDPRTRGKLDCLVAGPAQLADANGQNASFAEDQVCDVAVDSTGRIIVLDPYAHAVRIFVQSRVAQPPSAVPASQTEAPHAP